MPVAAIAVGGFVALGGLGGGCLVGFYTLTLLEPPHPEWGFTIGASGVSAGTTTTLAAAPYVVWMDEAEGSAPCELDVRHQDGTAVGSDRGGRHCSVSGQASAGEVWRIEARGGAGVPVSLAHNEGLTVPRPLKLGFAGAGLAFLMGLAAAVWGMLSLRRGRA